jgi:hypothetical protein
MWTSVRRCGQGVDSSVEVELDPESVPDIVDTLDRDGLRVVGTGQNNARHVLFSPFHQNCADII